MSQDPRIEAAAKAARIAWSGHDDWDGAPNSVRIAYRGLATAALAAADKTATITTVESLDALPVGTLVMCANVNPTWPAVFLHTGSKRDPWLALDPSDRDGGETTLDSGTVLTWHGKGTARVIHWGTE